MVEPHIFAGKPRGGLRLDAIKEAGLRVQGFNRFRKLLVRSEKLERGFVALNHLAAAIIAFRKVPVDVNIIYG